MIFNKFGSSFQHLPDYLGAPAQTFVNFAGPTKSFAAALKAPFNSGLLRISKGCSYLQIRWGLSEVSKKPFTEEKLHPLTLTRVDLSLPPTVGQSRLKAQLK